jgi:hypothetical protein
MECLESELVDGYCSECRENCKNNIGELQYVENKVANRLKIWELLFFFVGILSFVILMVLNIGVIYAIVSLCSSIFFSTLLGGFAEVIQLLEDIKNK